MSFLTVRMGVGIDKIVDEERTVYNLDGFTLKNKKGKAIYDRITAIDSKVGARSEEYKADIRDARVRLTDINNEIRRAEREPNFEKYLELQPLQVQERENIKTLKEQRNEMLDEEIKNPVELVGELFEIRDADARAQSKEIIELLTRAYELIAVQVKTDYVYFKLAKTIQERLLSESAKEELRKADIDNGFVNVYGNNLEIEPHNNTGRRKHNNHTIEWIIKEIMTDELR